MRYGLTDGAGASANTAMRLPIGSGRPTAIAWANAERTSSSTACSIAATAASDMPQVSISFCRVAGSGSRARHCRIVSAGT